MITKPGVNTKSGTATKTRQFPFVFSEASRGPGGNSLWRLRVRPARVLWSSKPARSSCKNTTQRQTEGPVMLIEWAHPAPPLVFDAALDLLGVSDYSAERYITFEVTVLYKHIWSLTYCEIKCICVFLYLIIVYLTVQILYKHLDRCKNVYIYIYICKHISQLL